MYIIYNTDVTDARGALVKIGRRPRVRACVRACVFGCACLGARFARVSESDSDGRRCLSRTQTDADV